MIDLVFDDGEFVMDMSQFISSKKASPKKKVEKEVKAPKRQELKKVDKVNKDQFNPTSTYIILPDGTYFEVARKDAMRLTNEELQLFIFKKHGLACARDMEIVRGTVK